MELHKILSADKTERDLYLETRFAFKALEGEGDYPSFALSEVRKEVFACDACGLCRESYHKNKVPGIGNPKTRIMFIGEGPGEDENQQGIPFVGKAGQLLNRLFLKAGLNREEIYISNIMKCRPPGNRNPEEAETAQCGRFIRAEISIIKPQAIVLLGGVALQYFFPGSRIMASRGKPVEIDGIFTVPTFHPAFLLRLNGDELKRRSWDMWNDVQLALNHIK